MNKTNSFIKKNGFSIIELLITIAILTILLTATIKVSRQNLSNTKISITEIEMILKSAKQYAITLNSPVLVNISTTTPNKIKFIITNESETQTYDTIELSTQGSITANPQVDKILLPPKDPISQAWYQSTPISINQNITLTYTNNVNISKEIIIFYQTGLPYHEN